MKFSEELRPLVERAGGSTKAASICGVSPQIVNLWLRGMVEPNKATQAGALFLLGKTSAELPDNSVELPDPDSGKKFLDHLANNPPIRAENGKIIVQVRNTDSRTERAPIFGGMLKAPKKS